MKLFLLIPTVLCYVAILLYLCAFLICAVICRREKRHSVKVLQNPTGGGQQKRRLHKEKRVCSHGYTQNFIRIFMGSYVI